MQNGKRRARIGALAWENQLLNDEIGAEKENSDDNVRAQ